MAFFSLHKRKAFFFALLFLVASVFTADVIDLREELRILSYPYSYLDNNVTTGIVSDTPLDTAPFFFLRAVDRTSSVDISFLHLLPYGFRAPPLTVWS